MRPIPPNLKNDMASDPFYSRCCLTGKQSGTIKIDWHHNFIFAGRQVNEKWCILPVWNKLHEKVSDSAIKLALDWIMLSRADEQTLKKYSKSVNLVQRRDKLNAYFGGAWDEGKVGMFKTLLL